MGGKTSAVVAYSEFSEFKDHDRALFVAPVALTPHVVLRSHHSFRHWGLLFCAPSYTAISLEILSLHGHIPFCVESRGGPSSFYEGMAFHARALKWIHDSLLPRKTSAKLWQIALLSQMATFIETAAWPAGNHVGNYQRQLNLIGPFIIRWPVKQVKQVCGCRITRQKVIRPNVPIIRIRNFEKI